MSIEEIRQITKAALEKQESEHVRRSNRINEYIETCMIDVRKCILDAAKQGRYESMYTEDMIRSYLTLTELGLGGYILAGIKQTLINEGYAVGPSVGLRDRIFIRWNRSS